MNILKHPSLEQEAAMPIATSCQLGFWSFQKSGDHFFDSNTFKILGLSSRETTFNNFISQIIEEDIEDFRDSKMASTILNSDYQLREPVFFDFRISLNDDTRYIRGRAFFTQDDVHGFIEDISDIKTVEIKKLQQVSRLANLGELASCIGHELSTPLSFASFYADFLKINIKRQGISLENIEKSIAMISKGLFQMNGMIKSMKFFNVRENYESFDKVRLIDIIKDSLDLCQDKIKYNNISLEVSVNDEISLECRPVQICQIITNLILNSIKSITDCHEKWIKIAATTNGDQITCSITDSGKGIPASISKHIMKPFFTTRGKEGSGVGLFIGREIAFQHNGNLCYDKESPNTRFNLTLPKSSPRNK